MSISLSHVADTADLAMERHARALADAMPQIVWTANPDGWLDYYNQQWVEYTGMTIEQTQGWGWAPVLHPDDLQHCVDVWRHSVNTGDPYEVEYRFKRASDGQYRWHLGRALAMRDAQGQVVKWFGTCTDIQDQKDAQALMEHRVVERTAELAQANTLLVSEVAERKRMHEEQLADAQRLNQIIATQSALVESELDIDEFFGLVLARLDLLTPAAGTVIEMREGNEMVYHAASGMAAGQVGLRLAVQGSLSGLCVLQREVLLCTDSDLDPRVDTAACHRLGVRSMIVAPLVYRQDAVGVIKAMAAQANAFTVRDVQTLQVMAGLIGAAIGNRKAFQARQMLLEQLETAMETLKSSESRAKTIIDGAFNAFVAIDADGKITDWNRQAEITFGWLGQEAIGRKVAALIIPERYRDAHAQGMARFAATGEVRVLNQRLELYAMRRDGSEFPVEMAIDVLRQGERLSFCSFLHDISDRRAAEERLTQMAQFDQLTGLPNRTLFNDRLMHAMARCQRTPQLMALMYLDIDRFKDINDTYGHQAGDDLLAEVARRLKRSVRSADTVARLGGDEFVVLVEDLHTQAASEVIATKLLDGMREGFTIAGRQLDITLSLGGVFYRGEDTTDPEDLIIQADTQLYRAKSNGRNQACWPENHS